MVSEYGYEDFDFHPEMAQHEFISDNSYGDQGLQEEENEFEEDGEVDGGLFADGILITDTDVSV